MKHHAAVLIVIGACSLWLGGQTVPATSPAASGPASGPASTQASQAGVAQLGEVRVDVKARQIVMNAEVCLREGALELLVCGWETKGYESIMQTRAKGWQLHTALLMLGLTPGKPARWAQSPDGDDGVFLPPQGPQLTITLRWKDASGQQRQAAAGEWLAVPGDKAAAIPSQWVFVGSDTTSDGQYEADVNGDIISVSNFSDAVIDVPFESSNKDALRSYEVRPDAVPPVGTPVEVVIAPVAGAESADHARVTIDIDRYGRLAIEGERLPDEDLKQWARQYTARHAKGQVVLRIHPRALAYDVARSREQLRLGGVADVQEEYLMNDEPVLPRSPQQAADSLKWWAAQFANARELIYDPAIEADATLRQVQRQAQEFARLQALAADFAAQLRPMLEKYQASTQPATRGRP
jgi:hypothetical protein